MDPNAALAKIRAALAEAEQTPTHARANVLREQAAEAMLALDGWLSNAGFLPDAWQGARP